MKKTISMNGTLYDFHNFGKENLISHDDGSDTYICEDCGIKGKRAFLSDEIYFSRVSKEKLSKCNGRKGIYSIETKERKKVKFTSEKVKITNDVHLFSFGVKNGDILETIICPNKEDETLDGVWVTSTVQPKGFRLLLNEFKRLNNG